MEPEQNSKLVEMCAGSFLPVTQSTVNSSVLWEKPRMKRFEKANRTAISFLDYATLYGFEHGKWVNLGIGGYVGANLFSDAMSKTVSGQMTAEEAAQWAAKEMEKFSMPIK
jgi:ABC-type glycerol-3-phosphate transport system substrate-binding protein